MIYIPHVYIYIDYIYYFSRKVMLGTYLEYLFQWIFFKVLIYFLTSLMIPSLSLLFLVSILFYQP